jgi:hypothetical protein
LLERHGLIERVRVERDHSGSFANFVDCDERERRKGDLAGALDATRASEVWEHFQRAQAPARFYWKTLSGANAVPVIVNSISGNSNPFDPSHVVVSADAKVDATMALDGYARAFTLFGRSGIGVFLVPMGRLSADVTVSGSTLPQATNGFGDPMFEFVPNVIGPPAQTTLPDVLRHEPGFSVDVLADLALPIGKYNNTQPLNLGQNRWYGRLGAPVLGRSAHGCRAGARRWNCSPSCGCSARTATSSGRRSRRIPCSSSMPT